MSSPPAKTALTVALIGNPNTGKSTLFGALVGVHQHVGNYPGVTVEKKTGRMEHDGRRYEVIDLPGLYSLAPRCRDEMVAVDVLLGRREDSPPVDAVISIVDAANLQRNLYLVSQVLELGLPTVVAVNMVDVAESRGIAVDVERLAQRLPGPVVAIRANRRIGLDRLKAALSEAIDGPRPKVETPFPEPFRREVAQLETLLAERAAAVEKPATEKNDPLPRYLVERLLLDTGGYLEGVLLGPDDAEVRGHLQAARRRLAEADCEVPGIETRARYKWAGKVLEGAVTQPRRYRTTVTDRIDRLLTHRLWGTLVFAAVMVVVFQSIFVWAEPVTDGIEGVTSAVGKWVESHMAAGAVRSLLVDGLIGGVGGVLVFLPQILILFFFIAILEDCGYMARAAFLMDRMMVRVGLSGKSFIPMLSCFACAVPGIMATRVIENERDRLTTILVAPLMTCSARLPVYGLLIAAFIPAEIHFGPLSVQGLTLLGLYVLGIVTAVAAALVLKRTILRGRTPPFLMELPSYKWPSLRTAFYRVTQRGWIFLRIAGTLILVVSILVWAALYYPRDPESVESSPRIRQLRAEIDARPADDPGREQLVARRQREIEGEYQRRSFLGQTGRLLEPAVQPLGWDWRIGCAVVASFPAREIVVATLGVIYSVGEDVDPESETGAAEFRARLENAAWDGSDPPRKVFTIPVALSIMVC
ncbi:MAG TPA: ferrous iron transport protein B, partial [Thermoguttaceae bacterium]|nr:ferrous iron transport protein B [Thermoguttaceae bacterium]